MFPYCGNDEQFGIIFLHSLIPLISDAERTAESESESACMTCSSVPTAVLTPHKHGSIDRLSTLSGDIGGTGFHFVANA